MESSKKYSKEQLEIINNIYYEVLKEKDINKDFRIKCAKKMLKYNFNDKDILEITELSQNDLDKIKD